MIWVLGLLAGLGIGLAGGVLLERRSGLTVLARTVQVIDGVVASVAESVRYPGSRQPVSQPEPSEAQTMFDDLNVDVPAAPAWMLEDDGEREGSSWGG